MKKFIVAVFFITGLSSVSYSREGDRIRVLSEESLSEKVTFKVATNSENGLEIKVSGIQDTLASLSLVDQRGSSSYYEYIKKNQSYYQIDLKNIEPGVYYVKLNTNNEIRLKMIVVE